MVTIEDFWKIDDQLTAKWGRGRNSYKHINYCGIEPVRPLQHYGYFCTPHNSLTFARTGGDGVHFGIVTGSDGKVNAGPVVMTVPMGRIKNVVVAEDLLEFFSIGYYTGWYALEEIAYDVDRAIEYFSGPDMELSRQELVFLEILRQELALKPVLLSKDRLKELEKRYFPILDVRYEL